MQKNILLDPKIMTALSCLLQEEDNNNDNNVLLLLFILLETNLPPQFYCSLSLTLCRLWNRKIWRNEMMNFFFALLCLKQKWARQRTHHPHWVQSSFISNSLGSFQTNVLTLLSLPRWWWVYCLHGHVPRPFLKCHARKLPCAWSWIDKDRGL